MAKVGCTLVAAFLIKAIQIETGKARKLLILRCFEQF